jgi:hypothetical protein
MKSIFMYPQVNVYRKLLVGIHGSKWKLLLQRLFPHFHRNALDIIGGGKIGTNNAVHDSHQQFGNQVQVVHTSGHCSGESKP